ncbi:hypothetical protein FRB99_008701 [Tulasnella sp. 403]|nr:hypothetical protein FRB99_008701 [Tulasnella sp. 403]
MFADITFQDHRDDGYEGNVSSIFQELESKLDIVLIEDLVVKRSHLNFGEASMMGPDSFGTVYKGEMLREPSAPGSVVAIRRLLPSVGRTEIPDEVIKRFISRLRSKHVNILQIAGYCTDPSPTGEIFLIHPYVSTGSLDTYLGRNALDHTRKMALKSLKVYFICIPGRHESFMVTFIHVTSLSTTQDTHCCVITASTDLYVISKLRRPVWNAFAINAPKLSSKRLQAQHAAMFGLGDASSYFELDLPDTKAEHYGMQFSGSGRFLGVVLPPDVLVWDLATREIRETRTFDRAVLVELDISSDDKFCVLGCENGVIHIWDIDDKESCRSTSLDGELRSLAISPGREVVAVGMRDSGVHLLSTRTFEALVRLDCQWIWTLRFSPDGDLLFGAGAERLARCWDVSSIKLETPGDMRQVPGLSFRGHKRIISSVSGNSAWLMSISDGGEVHAVNLATEAARGETQQIGSLPPTSVGHRMDLGPVSAEGSGYAVAHPGGSDKLIGIMLLYCIGSRTVLEERHKATEFRW